MLREFREGGARARSLKGWEGVAACKKRSLLNVAFHRISEEVLKLQLSAVWEIPRGLRDEKMVLGTETRGIM
jgi:hypothetical protein